MADNIEVALSYTVNGETKAVDSLAKYKKAKRELTDASLAGDKQAIKSLADLKDKIEDLNEATNTFKGSGVEKLTSSFGLMAQGFTSFDTGKISAGFKGIGAAMGAIPIFLLIEGIKLLIDNFDVVIKFVQDFTGATDDSAAAAERMTLAINQEAEALKVLTDASNEAYKTQLLNAKLQGASEEELANITRKSIEARIRLTQESIEVQVQEYNQLLANDEATADQLKSSFEKLNQAKGEKKKLSNELTNFDIQTKLDEQKRQSDHDKELLAKNKEYAAKLKAQKEADKKELLGAFGDSLNEEVALIDQQNKEILDRQKQRDADILAGRTLLAQNEKSLRDQAVAEAAKAGEDAIKLADDVAKAKLSTEKNAFDGTRALTEAFFQFRSNKASGDVAKQNELAKKAFNVNKALNLAQAGIEGFRSVQGTLAATAIYGPAVQIPAGIAAGIAAAGIIAKIASVKFQGATGGGDSSSGSFSSSSAGAPPPAPPQIQGPSGLNQTIINNNGQTGVLKAYVVESEMSATQKQVQKLTEQAQFG